MQMGVAVPYLENDLKELCAWGVLAQKGGRYETAVVIFTKEFAAEAMAKTLSHQQKIADIISNFLDERLSDIKSIGFHTGGSDDGLLRWHITQLIIEQAVLVKYEKNLNLVFPTKYGGESFVIGVENYHEGAGGLTTRSENACGDQIKFIEFFVSSIYEKLDFGYFYERANRVNIAIDIAKGKMDGFSENDAFEVAELIKSGWAAKDGGELSLCIPVYTAEQFEQIISMTDAVTDRISDATRDMIEISTDILVQHTPASMKKEAKEVGWLKRHDIAMKRPVEIMRDSGALRRIAGNEHPTAYVLLK